MITLRNTSFAAALVAATLLPLAAAAQVAAPAAAQNTAIIPTPFQPQRHEEFVTIAKKGDIDCLLMGDSITDWWRRAGQPVYEKTFGQFKCVNFGIAGDRTQGVLWRMENGELDGYTPKLMMLMIGTNNLSGGRGGTANTPEQIAEGITTIVTKFRTKFPEAKVLLLGVFPRGAADTSRFRQPIKDINARIAKLDDGKFIKFVDIGDKFLDSTGAIPVDVMADGLHPTQKGYEIWAAAILPTFTAMMQSK